MESIIYLQINMVNCIPVCLMAFWYEVCCGLSNNCRSSVVEILNDTVSIFDVNVTYCIIYVLHHMV